MYSDCSRSPFFLLFGWERKGLIGLPKERLCVSFELRVDSAATSETTVNGRSWQFAVRSIHGEREKGKFQRLGRRRGEREIYRTGFPYFLHSVKEEELRQSNMKKESNSKTSIQYDEPNIPNFMKSCSMHQQPIEEQPSNLHKQLEVGSLGQLGGRNRQIYINQLGRLKVLGLRWNRRAYQTGRFRNSQI